MGPCLEPPVSVTSLVMLFFVLPRGALVLLIFQPPYELRHLYIGYDLCIPLYSSVFLYISLYFLFSIKYRVEQMYGL